jgi:hypothetical protein
MKGIEYRDVHVFIDDDPEYVNIFPST